MKVKRKYVLSGFRGPKIYVAIMRKEEPGWTVGIYPCNTIGETVGEPVAWQDYLDWFEAILLFYKWYCEFDDYVNGRK